MRHVVLVRYGEIAVKTGRVREELERRLVVNIVRGLEREGLAQHIQIRREAGRIFIYVSQELMSRVIDVLRRVFGVKSVSPSVEVKFTMLDDIVKVAESLWADTVRGKTFAVRCHRVGKHSFTSRDVEAKVGEALVRYSRGVNLENPEVELKIEIRGDRAYLYVDEISGPGGLPLGSEGRAIALVSGGFDSPVAAWMVMRRGVCVDFLTVSLAGELDLLPALRVLNVLIDRWCIGYDPKVYIVHAEDLVKAIRENIKVELWNIVYKRCLYYIAEKIALQGGYRAIVTGDVIGQVSSQTLDNLYSTEFGLKIPVLRPLVGLDKDEVIQKAREIGTYEYSCQVAEYCAIFSTKPKTWSTPEEVELEFSKIRHIVDELVKEKVTVLRGAEVSGLISTLQMKIQNLDTEEVPSGSVILDVRPRKVPKLRLDGAEIIETTIDNVFEIVSRLGKDRTYLVYCTSPLVSRYVAVKLRELGYKAYSLVKTS